MIHAPIIPRTTIITALQQALEGEPAPSMGSPAFGEVIRALSALTAPGAVRGWEVSK